jgi:hypothetical protein
MIGASAYETTTASKAVNDSNLLKLDAFRSTTTNSMMTPIAQPISTTGLEAARRMQEAKKQGDANDFNSKLNKMLQQSGLF